MSFRSHSWAVTIAGRAFLFGIVFLGTIACDPRDLMKKDDKPDEQALARALAEQEKKRAIEAEALKKAAEKVEAQKAAEEAEKKKVAQSDQEQLLSCCEALGKEGFEKRSMEYMKGFDLCDAASKEGKAIAEVIGDIRAVIGKNQLPSRCSE